MPTDEQTTIEPVLVYMKLLNLTNKHIEIFCHKHVEIKYFEFYVRYCN